MYITREGLNQYFTNEVYNWGLKLIKDPQLLKDFIYLIEHTNVSNMNKAYDIVYAELVKRDFS